MYNEFLAFLRARVSSENLICVRMINVYEEMWDSGRYSETTEQAWTIYKFFVAPGSAFEVSVNHAHGREMMLSLAKPHPHLFDQVKRSAFDMLKVNFELFRSTQEYAGLAAMLRSRIMESGPKGVDSVKVKTLKKDAKSCFCVK
jgi:Regulator of G protein signaling domain